VPTWQKINLPSRLRGIYKIAFVFAPNLLNLYP